MRKKRKMVRRKETISFLHWKFLGPILPNVFSVQRKITFTFSNSLINYFYFYFWKGFSNFVNSLFSPLSSFNRISLSNRWTKLKAKTGELRSIHKNDFKNLFSLATFFLLIHKNEEDFALFFSWEKKKKHKKQELITLDKITWVFFNLFSGSSLMKIKEIG